MMYLSKGLLIQKNQNILTVSHCGAEYDLMDERAAVWESGRKGPREVDEVRRVSRRTGVCESGWQEPWEIINNNQEKILLELSKTGLAETSPDTGNEAVFRILINCAICPVEKLAFPALWSELIHTFRVMAILLL